MIEIDGPHFYAVVGVENGRAVTVPDNLIAVSGKTVKEVLSFCIHKGWRATCHEQVFQQREAGVYR